MTSDAAVALLSSTYIRTVDEDSRDKPNKPHTRGGSDYKIPLFTSLDHRALLRELVFLRGVLVRFVPCMKPKSSPDPVVRRGKWSCVERTLLVPARRTASQRRAGHAASCSLCRKRGAT